MNEQRKERGGSAVGMANTANAAVGQGGDHTMERVMSSMELTNSLIAKSMGETIIRGIFIELHKLIRENLQSGSLELTCPSRLAQVMRSVYVRPMYCVRRYSYKRSWRVWVRLCLKSRRLTQL